MPANFLLRFQVCAQSGDGRTTKTKTAIKSEQPDEGRAVPLAGTKTVTEVKREQADADPQGRALFAIPR